MCQTKFVKLKLENLLIEVFFLGFNLPPCTYLLNLNGQQHLRLFIGALLYKRVNVYFNERLVA